MDNKEKIDKLLNKQMRNELTIAKLIFKIFPFNCIITSIIQTTVFFVIIFAWIIRVILDFQKKIPLRLVWQSLSSILSRHSLHLFIFYLINYAVFFSLKRSHQIPHVNSLFDSIKIMKLEQMFIINRVLFFLYFW